MTTKGRFGEVANVTYEQDETGGWCFHGEAQGVALTGSSEDGATLEQARDYAREAVEFALGGPVHTGAFVHMCRVYPGGPVCPTTESFLAGPLDKEHHS